MVRGRNQGDIRKEILETIDPFIVVDDSFRMRHRTKSDGSPCSDGKDKALVVKRTLNGWMFYCHRCHEQGFIADKCKSPKEVGSMIEALRRKPQKAEGLRKATLPHDFLPLIKSRGHKDVPIGAFHWLWEYGLLAKDLIKYNIGWSKAYQRVIVPVYNLKTKELKGWVGREITTSSKEERQEKKIAKYLTFKGENVPRLWFIIQGRLSPIVLVEDVISAIKVNKVSELSTIALLGTHIDDTLMKAMRGHKVYVWLDSDALGKGIKFVNRYRQLGIDAKHIHTQNDPKACSPDQIVYHLASAIAAGEDELSNGYETLGV